MITESSQIFRITYEAFSKFSNTLNRCRTFDDIAECFAVNLKYLFNYHIFRASYQRNGTYVHLQVCTGNTTITVSDKPRYLSFEYTLLDCQVPQQWTDLSGFTLPELYLSKTEQNAELWGWNLGSEDKNLLVSVLAGSKKQFSSKDINFLKLVADNLETKLLELCLIKELDEKNAIISSINEQQKSIIKDRTKVIAIKNRRLLEISVLNAHNVREPLSRILGLVNLLENDEPELLQQVLPLIKISSTDLDTALHNVIDMATKDLLELKAE